MIEKSTCNLSLLGENEIQRFCNQKNRPVGAFETIESPSVGFLLKNENKNKFDSITFSDENHQKKFRIKAGKFVSETSSLSLSNLNSI